MPGEKYKAGTFISKEYVGGLDLNNSSLFNKTENPEELAGEYKARETVTAGYLRFDQNFGKKLSAMASGKYPLEIQRAQTDTERRWRSGIIDCYPGCKRQLPEYFTFRLIEVQRQ